MENTSHLHIIFFSKSVEDPATTLKEGIPKFKDEIMCRIQFVGDRNTVLEVPADGVALDPEDRVQKSYKERFPKHYQAFLEGRGDFVDGTPLEQLPGITASRIAEFRAQKVHTIEALAALDGGALQRLGAGGREWKNKATIWLETARDGALETRFANENEILREQMAAMQAQLEALKGGGVPPAAAGGTSTVVGDKDKAPVVTEGRFKGHTEDDLRRYILSVTNNKAIKGKPTLEALAEMAETLAAQQDKE